MVATHSDIACNPIHITVGYNYQTSPTQRALTHSRLYNYTPAAGITNPYTQNIHNQIESQYLWLEKQHAGEVCKTES